MSAKSKRAEERKARKQQQPNLGQKEAKRQQRSESELSHMGAADSAKTKTAKNNEREHFPLVRVGDEDIFERPWATAYRDAKLMLLISQITTIATSPALANVPDTTAALNKITPSA